MRKLTAFYFLEKCKHLKTTGSEISLFGGEFSYFFTNTSRKELLVLKEDFNIQNDKHIDDILPESLIVLKEIENITPYLLKQSKTFVKLEDKKFQEYFSVQELNQIGSELIDFLNLFVL